MTAAMMLLASHRDGLFARVVASSLDDDDNDNTTNQLGTVE